MNVTATLYKPVLQWAARQAVVGRHRDRMDPSKARFTRADVDQLLGQSWRNFDRLAHHLPAEPTAGSRMNVALAGMTLSVFQAFTAAGVERGYAIELIGDAAWHIYTRWATLPQWIAPLLTHDQSKRMRIRVDLFLRFPFNPPGYQFTRRALRDGAAFDVTRCPVAEYFRAHGAPDLCLGTWCNLDYALAEQWDGWMERNGTLAAGDDRCDFRFKVNSPVVE